MPDGPQQNPLDYADPDVQGPSRRRDSLEYYREPPAIAGWTIGGIVGWIIAYIVVGVIIMAVVGAILSVH